MPEGPELENELERLKDSIVEEREEKREEESDRRGFLTRVSLSTALIAVIAALAALEAGSTVNEALLKKNESIALSTAAFDGWAQYQAKGIKSAILTAQKQILISMDKVPPPVLDGDISRYQKEQADISEKSRQKEEQARRGAEEAEHLVHRHHRFASAVALLQIAVALSAIAALARNRAMWGLSLLIAAAGTLAFLDGFLLLL
jgi:hypothetical protein